MNRGFLLRRLATCQKKKYRRQTNPTKFPQSLSLRGSSPCRQPYPNADSTEPCAPGQRRRYVVALVRKNFFRRSRFRSLDRWIVDASTNRKIEHPSFSIGKTALPLLPVHRLFWIRPAPRRKAGNPTREFPSSGRPSSILASHEPPRLKCRRLVRFEIGKIAGAIPARPAFLLSSRRCLIPPSLLAWEDALQRNCPPELESAKRFRAWTETIYRNC